MTCGFAGLGGQVGAKMSGELVLVCGERGLGLLRCQGELGTV